MWAVFPIHDVSGSYIYIALKKLEDDKVYPSKSGNII